MVATTLAVVVIPVALVDACARDTDQPIRAAPGQGLYTGRPLVAHGEEAANAVLVAGDAVDLLDGMRVGGVGAVGRSFVIGRSASVVISVGQAIATQQVILGVVAKADVAVQLDDAKAVVLEGMVQTVVGVGGVSY